MCPGYHDEVIGVLAEQVPDLHEALERAADADVAYVILDGKVSPPTAAGEKTTSVKGELIDVWYSGKAHEHGGNIQTISAPPSQTTRRRPGPQCRQPHLQRPAA